MVMGTANEGNRARVYST